MQQFQLQEQPKQAKIAKSKGYKDLMKGHRDTLISLVSPYGKDGNFLFSASRDGQIRAWDLINREIASKLLISRFSNETTINEEEEQYHLFLITYSSGLPNAPIVKSNFLSAATFGEKSIYSAYDDGYICSRNIRSGELLYQFEGHKGTVTGLQFLNVRQLASSSNDGTVRLWDSTSGSCEVIFNVGQPINCMNISDNSIINILYGKNTIVQIDAQRQSIIRSVQFPNFIIMSFLVAKGLLFLGTIDNLIHIYDISTLDQANPQPIKVIMGGQGWALCMLIHEPYLFVGTDDKRIKVFDLKTYELKDELMGHKDGVTTLTVANGMLYSGSFDHFIRSWDLKELEQRIREIAIMQKEDLFSKRYDVYLKSLPKKKRGPAKKKK